MHTKYKLRTLYTNTNQQPIKLSPHKITEIRIQITILAL